MEVKLKFPLKDLLRHAIRGNYDEFQLRELYRLFVTFARQLVRRKIFSGKLNPEFMGMSEPDMVHDCIAELFTRSSRNELIEIAKYFDHEQIDIESLHEERLLIHVRRLIFTAVNDNIFRMYNEIDPPLGKILRNIKNTVGRCADFQLTNQFGEQHLEFVSGNVLQQYPILSDEDLQRLVERIMATETEIPSIVMELKHALESQNKCRRAVRLVSLALAIKKGYELLAFELQTTEDGTKPDAVIDSRSAIQLAFEQISAKIKERYLESGKIDKQTFECYSNALRRMLEDEFMLGSNGAISYYQYVSHYYPDLTRKEYERHHRTTFEYLAKLAKERVRKGLKEI
ncbi:MAG: hypothetical protein ABSF91_14110 [Bacteroidota bacterium]|jgi:hypothetical protein